MQAKRKVSLIEDHDDNREMMQVMLSSRYQVVCYASGRAALNAMSSDLPDIVLVDIAMPDMDGLAIVEKMRSTPALSQIPVIAVTAHAMLGDREKYLAAGFNDYMAKPIHDFSALHLMIENNLRRLPGE